MPVVSTPCDRAEENRAMSNTVRSKKAAPIEAEATATHATVELRNKVKVTVPLDRDQWSIDLVMAFRNEDAVGVVLEFLSDDEFAKFKAGGTRADLRDAYVKIVTALGLGEPGE